mmetsp:Transcript_33163/g.74909  ORF Transcript_33163/g.74909 Transcript_33163/m.74909 type:complete len:951 (+) Transcript_33163:310-3162(+)
MHLFDRFEDLALLLLREPREEGCHRLGERLGLERGHLGLDRLAVLLHLGQKSLVRAVRLAKHLGHLRRGRLVLHPGLAQVLDQLLLRQAPLDAPVEVLAGLLPLEHVAHHALGLHAPRPVVQVRELMRHLEVEREERGLAVLDLLGERGDVVRAGGLRQVRIQAHEHGVELVHLLELVLAAELHLADPRGLEDPAARLLVAVHLHHLGVDGGVDDHPGAAAELAVGRDVHLDGVLVLDEGVDNHGAELEDLARHVARPAAEPTPVGEDDERQVLAPAEVLDRLGRLVRAVRVPHLSRLGLQGLARGRVGRVGRDALLHQPGLHRDDAHGDAAEAGAPDHHRLAPVGQVLGEGALVEEAAHPSLWGLVPGQHVTRVVWGLGGHEVHGAVHRVAPAEGHGPVVRRLGHVGEPLHDLRDALLVVVHHQVAHAVGGHDLRAAELVLRRVHLPPEKLVQGRVARQDERAHLHLDGALAQAHEVGADAHRAARHVRQREHVVVRVGRLARNGARAAQVLHPDAVDLADDVAELEPGLAARLDLLALDRALGQRRVVLRREVEVVEALARVGLVLPRHLEEGLERLHEADAGARVAGNVHPGKALRARVLARRLEEVVLEDAEGARLDRHVVGNHHHLAALGVLRGLHEDAPREHAHRVGAHHALNVVPQHALLVEDELLGLEEPRRDPLYHGRRVGRLHPVQVLAPLLDQVHLHEAQKVVRVGRRDAADGRALHLELVGRRVRVQEADALLVDPLLVDGAELGGDARHGVGVLDKGRRFEPLAVHGRGHEAHRGDGVALLAPHLDLDLVHLELEQPRREAGLHLLDELAVELVRLLRVAVQLLQQVHVDAGRGGDRDARVEHGAVQLVERLLHLLHHALLRHDALVERHPAVKEHLRLDPPHHALHAKVHLGEFSEGFEAGELEVLLEAAELEEVHEGRAHVPPEKVLLEPVARGE